MSDDEVIVGVMTAYVSVSFSLKAFEIDIYGVCAGRARILQPKAFSLCLFKNSHSKRVFINMVHQFQIMSLPFSMQHFINNEFVDLVKREEGRGKREDGVQTF